MADESSNADGSRRFPWSASQVVSVVAVLALVGALAAGAAVVGAPDRAAAEDPAAYIASFYETGDVEGLLEALAPGSITEEQLDQARQDLARLLQPGVEVSVTNRYEIAGTTVTEVTTADRLNWCVTPDGTVFVRCRLGEAPVTFSVGDAPLEAALTQADVFPDHVELFLGISPVGDEPVTLDGIELSSADLQLVQAAAGPPGQLGPVTPDELQLEPGSTLYLVWRGEPDAVLGETFTLTWNGGSAEVQVGDADYAF